MARPVPLQARLRHGGDGRSQARGHTEKRRSSGKDLLGQDRPGGLLTGVSPGLYLGPRSTGSDVVCSHERAGQHAQVIHLSRTSPLPEPTGRECSISEVLAVLSIDPGVRGTRE